MHLQARGYPTEETQRRIHEIQFESRQEHLEDAQTTKQNRPLPTVHGGEALERHSQTSGTSLTQTPP